MKVFLDTNVILEFFLDREDGKTAGRLFSLLQEQKHSLFMTVGSFYTMMFLVDKYLRKERGLHPHQHSLLVSEMGPHLVHHSIVE